MINDKLIIDNEDHGDMLQNNAVPLPNAGSSSILQNLAAGSLASNDGIQLQQQISPWLQRQHSPLNSQGNASSSSSSGGSLLAGIPLSDLKKEQRRDWSSNNGRGNRSKNKQRQRKNDRENRKKRKGNNRRNNRDFGRDDIFGKNDRQRGGGRKEKRGNKSKADWAKALGSYPVVSSGKATDFIVHFIS